MADPRAVIHMAGAYDPSLGQLCSRCGAVLDTGLAGKAWQEGHLPPPRGWQAGTEVLVAGHFRASVAALREDRDRSDEIHCSSVAAPAVQGEGGG